MRNAPVGSRRVHAGFSGLVLAVSCIVSPAAHAVPLLFTFSGADVGTFEVDSNPTPNYLDFDSFGTPISNATGVFAGAGGAEFYLAPGGGLALYAGPGSSTFVGIGGAQLFTGPLTNPVFHTGNFALQDSGSSGPVSLSVTGPGAPAPELAGGLAGLAAFAALALARLRRAPALFSPRARAATRPV